MHLLQQRDEVTLLNSRLTQNHSTMLRDLQENSPICVQLPLQVSHGISFIPQSGKLECTSQKPGGVPPICLAPYFWTAEICHCLRLNVLAGAYSSVYKEARRSFHGRRQMQAKVRE